MRPPLALPLSRFVAILLMALPAMGMPESLERLVSNSPFAPAPGAAVGNATAPLEFRGVFADQGELFFSIFDPITRSSAWVSLNEPGHAFAVRSYDENTQSISAEHKGRTLSLTLKKAPIVAMPPDPTVPTVATGGPPIPVALTANAANDEAKRLAMLAAEIRRRRAMRQQVANPSNTAPAPASQP
jgi:hypothetical protein